MATAAALEYGDYAITEAGFGADLGAEKFYDIHLGKRPRHQWQQSAQEQRDLPRNTLRTTHRRRAFSQCCCKGKDKPRCAGGVTHLGDLSSLGYKIQTEGNGLADGVGPGSMFQQIRRVVPCRCTVNRA